MKNKTIIITGLVITIAVLVIIAGKTAAKRESQVTFETVKAELGTISNTVTATGTIEALKTVNVGTQVSGILQHIYVDFNDNVKQGQLLAKLDETSLLAQFDQSQSAVNQAQAQLNYTEATYKRLKVLFDKDLVAQADYDQALYNYENSKGSLSNAKSALARAKVNLDYATITSPIDGVVLNRAVEEGQTVAASFNTPTLFTIVNDLTQMEVQTNVDEADIGKVKQGQRVEFTVDAYPDIKFEGAVSELRLQPVTTNNVVTYVVILSAPNPEKKLMPGMTASAKLFVDEKTNTLVLPGKATRFIPDAEYLKKMDLKMAKENKSVSNNISGSADSMNSTPVPVNGTDQILSQKQAGGTGTNPDPKIKTVWIKSENGGLRPALIKTGIDNGITFEVVSGLKEGEEVIVSMNSLNSPAVVKRSNSGPQGPFPF
jgi:HlyD family secretion protein